MFGTIIATADQISEDEEYVFCVFRAVIGKSYCHKLKDSNDDEDSWKEVPLKDGYDSIYLENEDSNPDIF